MAAALTGLAESRSDALPCSRRVAYHEDVLQDDEILFVPAVGQLLLHQVAEQVEGGGAILRTFVREETEPYEALEGVAGGGQPCPGRDFGHGIGLGQTRDQAYDVPGGFSGQAFVR